MTLALEWTFVALFFAVSFAILAFAARAVFSRAWVREDERRIRKAFEFDGARVLSIDPSYAREAFPTERGARTYTVLVKPRRGAEIKHLVEFTGRVAQPTIVY